MVVDDASGLWELQGCAGGAALLEKPEDELCEMCDGLSALRVVQGSALACILAGLTNRTLQDGYAAEHDADVHIA